MPLVIVREEPAFRGVLAIEIGLRLFEGWDVGDVGHLFTRLGKLGTSPMEGGVVSGWVAGRRDRSSWGRWRRREGFDVGDQVHDLLFGELAVEAGHDVGIAFDDLVTGGDDVFAEIGFVGEDALPRRRRW